MRDFMKLGMGVLRWSPADFWASTPHELIAAIEGYAESKGIETPAKRKAKEDDYEQWAARVMEAEARRNGSRT